MIYISTGGVRDKSGDVVAAELLEAGANAVELSGGAYSETMLDDLQALKQDIHFQIHNYFPPPAEPFVLNLGSLDPTVGEQSVAHVEKALQWCVAVGADRYSFHAGFLLDPRVDELGRRIPNRDLFDRDECIDVFVKRVTRLAKIASRSGVRLMIENNVLSAKNAAEFSANPLLMCDPDESRQVLERLPADVGFLIDVAHLKVSANSLQFDPVAMFEHCYDRIAGHHLSDNNGLEDSNQRFDENAWFWPHLKKDAGYFSIEVYGCTPGQLLAQSKLAQSKLYS